MGCFEDFMQFRDEVDEVRKKILVRGATNGRRCTQDLVEKKEGISKPKAKDPLKVSREFSDLFSAGKTYPAQVDLFF